MKTFYPLSVDRSSITKTFLVVMLYCSVSSAQAQKRACKDCFVPSFGAITLYHITQAHSSFGFGMEAGKWNKDDSRFSYFIGAKLQWFHLDPNSDKYNNSADNIHYTVYVKGQFELLDRLYVVAGPEFYNLSSLDARTGLRYVFPISNFIGIGVEPAYSFVQKQCSVNANIHFALR